MSSIVLIAVTHQTAPLPVLERVALDADSASAVAAVLRAMRGVEEVVVLATCNRTELYVVSDVVDSAPWCEALAVLTGAPLDAISTGATVAVDDAASLHLFRVAAGLESRIVGERQILGQVRAAVARAVEAGTAGPRLVALFQWAVGAARRANRQGRGAARPSLARTALDAMGTRSEPHVPVLVIGAGAMAAAVTTELARDHVPYRVCARRPQLAARLTRRREHAVRFDDLGDELSRAEVVVCTTGASTPIISVAAVAGAMAGRVGRPLKIVDLSMPRNVAPQVAALPDVTLCGLDDLMSDRTDPHAVREAEVVAAEHRRYRAWLASREAGALIAAVHERVHALCLTEAVRLLGPGPDAARVARGIAGKLAHDATLRIKDLSARGDDASVLAVAAAFGAGAGAGASGDAVETSTSVACAGAGATAEHAAAGHC